MEYDPVESWNRTGQPTLVVYGDLDEQDNVPVRRSLARLERLRARPGAPRVEVDVMSGMGHTLVDPARDWVSRTVLRRVADWMVEGGPGGELPNGAATR